MIALFVLVGIALLVLVMFRAAIHALPVLVGLSVGATAYQLGAGPLVGFVLGVLAGCATFGFARSLAASGRFGRRVALVYSAIAGTAGFQISLTFARLSGATTAWTIVLGVVGVLLVGGAAWRRFSHRPRL